MYAKQQGWAAFARESARTIIQCQVPSQDHFNRPQNVTEK